jgi:hypothetical protein
MWINGSTLRVRFMGGNPAQQALVKEQALWWTQHANLTFDFNNAPDAEIRIAFNSSDGAWSYIGTDCQGIPRNQPTMNLGFLDGGTAAHEFGHAIGLGHEHQNPDGGIEWNEEVVMRELSGPPNNWSPEEIRHNVLEKYAVDQIRGTKFDPDSIMLYFFPGSWVKSGKGTQANDVLSPMEKTFIASKDAYPRVVPSRGRTGHQCCTHAGIDRPAWRGRPVQVYGQARRPACYRDGGQTDVVMKLFGPDVQTRLIAEDDDGGVGLNAKNRRPLESGRIFCPGTPLQQERAAPAPTASAA